MNSYIPPGSSCYKWDDEVCNKKIRGNKTCNQSAHIEVYWKDEKGIRHWSYLCKKHYYLDRIKNFIFRWRNWYCDLD